MPPRTDATLFDNIYQDLGYDETARDFTDRPYTDLDQFTRDELLDSLRAETGATSSSNTTIPLAGTLSCAVVRLSRTPAL